MAETELIEHAEDDKADAANGAGEFAPADLDETAETAACDVLSPGEVLRRIREGQSLTGVRVVGLAFSNTCQLPIRLKNCTLVRPTFKGEFADKVELVGCTLIRPQFTKARFLQGLILNGSTLKSAKLNRITVQGPFDLYGAKTTGQFSVKRCDFHQEVHCWEAAFEGWIDVHHCRFRGFVDLRSFHADQGACFHNCDFQGDVLFRGSTVSKKLSFNGSRFAGKLDLAKAKLHDFVYLEEIEQGEAQRLAFANAVAEKILIRPQQIEGRLLSELEGDHGTAMQEYGLLKRNFESLHRYDDEDWAFYRFKQNQRRHRATEKRRFGRLRQACDTIFLDWGCGYGTNPMRAVVAAVLIMVLFAAIYASGISHFQIDNPPVAELPPSSVVNRALFGLVTSVSVFTSGFTGDHLHHAHGWMLVPLAAEALMGTLLWGLFIVAFSRKVIR